MQTVAEIPTFSRQADRIFSEDEKREVIGFLSENPLTGDEIPGTGGVRNCASLPLDAVNAGAHG